MEKFPPTIFDSLGHAHKGLLAGLEKLEKTIHFSGKRGLGCLSMRLRATRQHVLEHFRFEEEDGYMDKVRKREPRLERAVRQLAQEHRQLLQSLDALLDQANAATTVTDALREGIRAWIGLVRKHEARETRLVQDAFGFDIGVED